MCGYFLLEFVHLRAKLALECGSGAAAFYRPACFPRRLPAVGEGCSPALWDPKRRPSVRAFFAIYVKSLAAPFTVNTMPEGTLKALADHGELGTILSADGGDCEEVLGQFESTSTPWLSSFRTKGFRTKGRSRSSSHGTS
jgi:hypothetical protein